MKKLLKSLLISTFFSYYFVAIALNFPWINTHFSPLIQFNLVHYEKVNEQLYLGTYPDEKSLRRYQHDFGLQRVITLLDPDFPLSRELVQVERAECEKLGIELIIIPIPFLSQNPMDYVIVRDLLDEVNKVTLIHTYYFDGRMKLMKKLLQRYNPGQERDGSVSRRSK